MANTWNKAGTTWGYNSWESDTVTVSLTGLSATSSIGSVIAFNETGWGRDSWGDENWGESAITVSLTGISGAISLGTVSPVHYRDDTITGSTSYTSVDITGYTAYTVDTHVA